MSENLNPQPPSWGKDDLSAFFDVARSNAFATHHNLSRAYKRMVDLDALFLSLFSEFHDPEHPLGATLALRCHSALRAGAQLALSGQVPETFMVARGALELALYAHHAASSDERTQIWMDRHESEQTRRRSSSEFSPRKIFPELRARAPIVGAVAGELYERTIDYGAHPNAAGVLTTMTYEENTEGQSFSFSYLSGDSLSQKLALKSWLQVAICCLDIFMLVLPERSAQLRLGDRLVPLREGL